MMRRAKHIVVAAAIAMSASGAVFAQAVRDGRYPATTGTISPPTAQLPPAWSGESGASGHPQMTAEAIRAGAANFHACIERLWPAAAHRGISRTVFQNYTAALTPDLRIMDLLDNQPEFTKSFWDYLDTPDRCDRVAVDSVGAFDRLECTSVFFKERAALLNSFVRYQDVE